MTRAEFCAFARAHDNFVILTHRRPDGDTIGSAGALCLGLRQLGKTAFVLTNEQFTPRFDPFLDGLVCEALPAGATVISADIASEGLLSFDAVRMGLTPVCAVDHHGSNSLACPKLVEADKAACGEIVHALSFILFADNAYARARKICEKLKDNIPRQMFEIPVQAAVGGKIIARETVKAMRKDVLAKCYGGDITRKKKLLEKQKEGKKKMRQLGSVSLPSEAFTAVLKLDSTDD